MANSSYDPSSSNFLEVVLPEKYGCINISFLETERYNKMQGSVLLKVGLGKPIPFQVRGKTKRICNGLSVPGCLSPSRWFKDSQGEISFPPLNASKSMVSLMNVGLSNQRTRFLSPLHSWFTF